MSLGPPVLEIRILGNVDVRSGESQLAPLESARAVSLLGYLLVHRGVALPRERLAFLLWPDSTEAQARTNLRHVLHTLRRGLPDADRFVEVTSRTLRWRADAPYWLDLAEFERALAEGRLADAVDAYGGDLLEGTYDDWVIESASACASATSTPSSGSCGSWRSARSGRRRSTAPSASCGTIRCARTATARSCACTTRAASGLRRCAPTTRTPPRCNASWMSSRRRRCARRTRRCSSSTPT